MRYDFINMYFVLLLFMHPIFHAYFLTIHFVPQFTTAQATMFPNLSYGCHPHGLAFNEVSSPVK